MNYIYIYTTESFKEKSWYKIGQSINCPYKRVAAQDNSSNPEPLLAVYSWVVNDDITDKHIHSLLEDSGFNRLRPGKEWFELSDNPIDDVSTIISSMGQEIIEYTGITDNHNNRSVDISYDNIPHYTDLWWYIGLSPEDTVPKQLDLLLIS